MQSQIAMKVDVYKLERRYKNWKIEALQEGVAGLTLENSKLLVQFILDMEIGRNTARCSKSGGRSYVRLVSLQQRLKRVFGLLQDRGVNDVRQATEAQVVELFSALQRGTILTRAGSRYASEDDYARDFKSFWHWWMKLNRKEGRSIADITEDVGSRQTPSRFVYLQKSDVEVLVPFFERDEQVLILFLFDSLVRAPTEVMSLRAKDIYESDGEVWVNVPAEISKTIGRTFNLFYAGEALREYLNTREPKPDDPLFSFSPPYLNRKLKKVAARIFGSRLSHPEGDRYDKLSLYDFRHSGAIHFRLLAKDNPGQISLNSPA